MRFLLFLLCQTFLRLAFSVTFCERRNWRPFWYNTALSKWESPHFFARFKFRKLHANVFKSAAILPRNGQFVLTTSTNDKQSISRSQGDVITRPDQFQWRFLARLRSWVIGARTILFAISLNFWASIKNRPQSCRRNSEEHYAKNRTDIP